MIKIDVSADFAPALKMLEGFSGRRLNAAVATALTRTARDIGEQWKQQMSRDLDRPTSYVTRSIKVTRADANTLTAKVYLREDGRPGEPTPAEILAVHEEGVDRSLRKFERALVSKGAMPRGHRVVPAYAAKLDGYGNISRGQIVQVLNQLGGSLSVGYQRVISKSAAKRAQAAIKSGRTYVAIVKKESATGNKPPGIWEKAKDGRILRPVFWFVSTTKYKKRTRLVESGAVYAKSRIVREVERSLAEHRARLGIK